MGWREECIRSYDENLAANSKVFLLFLSVLVIKSPFMFPSRYLSYGSGPKRFPLADVLQYAMEFASSKPVCTSPVEDIDTSAPPAGTVGQQLPLSRQVKLWTSEASHR